MVWLMRQFRSNPKSPYADLDIRPFDPATDAPIDNFISSWKESMPNSSHGGLIERDFLTTHNGDYTYPTSTGAVLKNVKKFSRVTLYAGKKTVSTILSGEQEVFYILSGAGTITGGGQTFDLYPGVVVLVPENLEFSISNIGDDAMTAYLVTEPTLPGFRPSGQIVWRDENNIEYASTNDHWVENVKVLLGPEDGLSLLDGCYTVTLNPETFSQPHSHGPGEEVVWAALQGDAKLFLGKQLRDLPEGFAYLVPPDDATPHANFNTGDIPVKLFYFSSSVAVQ